MMAITALIISLDQLHFPKDPSALFLPTAHLGQNTERFAFRVLRIVTVQDHSAPVTRRSLAAGLILRFIRRMIRVSMPGSKLCLVTPDHATTHRPSADAVAPTWQGRAVPSVASFPCAAFGGRRTVAGSAPPAGVRP
jgi:hypothetical protein